MISQIRLRRRQLAILILVISIASFGYGPCSGKNQPLTVADVLTRAGNVKRELRERERQVPGTGISAQTDYDIFEATYEPAD